MTRKGHKSYCHRQNVRLGTKCKCQKPSGHSRTYLTPDSTDECVVFEYDKANHKWKTSNYSPSQTKDQASVGEIEQFLNEINEPLGAWSKQYGKIAEGGGTYFCIAIFLSILLPIFFIYMCWFNKKQDQAKAKFGEVEDKVRELIQKRRSYFSEKRLTWQVPEQFPQWIELWLDEEGKPSKKQEEKDLAMVGYEKSGYPRSPKVVPIGGQQQLTYNADTYGE